MEIQSHQSYRFRWIDRTFVDDSNDPYNCVVSRHDVLKHIQHFSAPRKVYYNSFVFYNETFTSISIWCCTGDSNSTYGVYTRMCLDKHRDDIDDCDTEDYYCHNDGFCDFSWFDWRKRWWEPVIHFCGDYCGDFLNQRDVWSKGRTLLTQIVCWDVCSVCTS